MVNDQSGDRINLVEGNLDNPRKLESKDIPGFDMGNLLLAISIKRSGRADHLCPVCNRDADLFLLISSSSSLEWNCSPSLQRDNRGRPKPKLGVPSGVPKDESTVEEGMKPIE